VTVEGPEPTTGIVARGTVIAVLKAVAQECGFLITEEMGTITLIKDSVPEVIILSESVPRRMIGRFVGKYGVKVEYFYHPELCLGGNSTRH
jgi:hypothetical protein